jgi:hypothetical protein
MWENLHKTSIDSDVLRTSAIQTVQEIFGKWLPDGGLDYVTKVRNMVGTYRGMYD